MKKNKVKKIVIENEHYHYYPLDVCGVKHIKKMPFVKRILLENLLRNQEKSGIEDSLITSFVSQKEGWDIPFFPTRVLMQDFTGVPAVVDLASVKDVVETKFQKGDLVQPLIPVDIIIDHSVELECTGSPSSIFCNTQKEYQQNKERYEFLKWASLSFDNMRIVPPSSGICHQVNLEYLASVIYEKEGLLFPDSLIGTDSHTTMINGVGILGWGVGGIEAEATMLGLEYTLSDIKVVGVNLTGVVDEKCTSTDIVLSITELLRKEGVVGEFVEFFGKGYQTLTVVDRATIANMSPEFGSTTAYFPIDEHTITYLRLTNREKEAAIVESYAKENHLIYDEREEIEYDRVITFDLSSVKRSLAGPTRPQDRISLQDVSTIASPYFHTSDSKSYKGMDPGSIAIAAITSCTNTSNPKVMIGAALLAKKAVEKGLKVKPWVKTSFAPGSQVVTKYLSTSGLLPYLEQLGFYVDAYGCTTCIGNSGPLFPISDEAYENGVPLAAILSGNRNFTGRIHQKVKGSFLASPLLVAAFAIAGNITRDIYNEPLGKDENMVDIYLDDIWPSKEEIEEIEKNYITKELYKEVYENILDGDDNWKELNVTKSLTYNWNKDSTYIQKAPFFDSIGEEESMITPIYSSHIIGIFKDSITTDHISPAGAINPSYPAGVYLKEKGVSIRDFNSYGSRRGNDEVMVRGTFANIRLKNIMMGSKEGGYTIKYPQKEEGYFYDVAMKYKDENIPLIIFAGKEYGTGSSRDWAAKGTYLLGIKAVIAESFERIHRSNLIGMGVLPLEFMPHNNALTLNLKGDEVCNIYIDTHLSPKQIIEVAIIRSDNTKESFPVVCKIENQAELLYYKHKGILTYAMNQLLTTL